MNVHRWRKLEGADPKAYEMLQKIQTLQKRLIQKTEVQIGHAPVWFRGYVILITFVFARHQEVVEKDLLIQEKSKLYDELKAILARQPGPEIVEELTRLQLLLKEKQRQMKAMASELNMYRLVAIYSFMLLDLHIMVFLALVIQVPSASVRV